MLVTEFPHALDLLLDVLDQVGLFGELLLVDTLDRKDLVFRRCQLYLFRRKDVGKGTLPQFLQGVQVVLLESVFAVLQKRLLHPFIFELYRIK